MEPKFSPDNQLLNDFRSSATIKNTNGHNITVVRDFGSDYDSNPEESEIKFQHHGNFQQLFHSTSKSKKIHDFSYKPPNISVATTAETHSPFADKKTLQHKRRKTSLSHSPLYHKEETENTLIGSLGKFEAHLIEDKELVHFPHLIQCKGCNSIISTSNEIVSIIGITEEKKSVKNGIFSPGSLNPKTYAGEANKSRAKRGYFGSEGNPHNFSDFNLNQIVISTKRLFLVDELNSAMINHTKTKHNYDKFDKMSVYYEINCSRCNAFVGKHYLSTVPVLAFFRNRNVLFENKLVVYRVGTNIEYKTSRNKSRKSKSKRKSKRKSRSKSRTKKNNQPLESSLMRTSGENHSYPLNHNVQDFNHLKTLHNMHSLKDEIDAILKMKSKDTEDSPKNAPEFATFDERQHTNRNYFQNDTSFDPLYKKNRRSLSQESRKSANFDVEEDTNQIYQKYESYLTKQKDLYNNQKSINESITLIEERLSKYRNYFEAVSKRLEKLEDTVQRQGKLLSMYTAIEKVTQYPEVVNIDD